MLYFEVHHTTFVVLKLYSRRTTFPIYIVKKAGWILGCVGHLYIFWIQGDACFLKLQRQFLPLGKNASSYRGAYRVPLYN